MPKNRYKDQSDLLYPDDMLPEEAGLEEVDFIPTPIPVNPRAMMTKISKGIIQRLRKQWRSLDSVGRKALLKKGVKSEKDFVKRGEEDFIEALKKKTPGSSGKHRPGSRSYARERAKYFEKVRKEGPRPKDFYESGSDRVYTKPGMKKIEPSGRTLRWDKKTGKVEEIEDL